MRTFTESDWKLLRELKDIALERLCQRILHQVAHQCDCNEPHHQRFLRVHSLVDKGNADIARAFDGMRRSTAFMHLFAMRELQLIADDELSRFSAETRDKILELERSAAVARRTDPQS